MELKKIKLKNIKEYEKNARKNDKAVEAVVKSIQQCEYIAPIILDENNIILAGHTRYKALKKLGYEECECIIKEGLTKEQKKKYRLLDNKTNELSDWDFDLLAEELEGLDFDDLDLDWGIEEKKEKDIKEVVIKPYKKVHYLITADINKNQEILNALEILRKEDIEIESTLN